MLIDASMRRPIGQKFSRTWIFQVLAVVLLLPHAAAAQTAGWFEAPPLVPAQVLAPASLVSGGGFRVDSPVPTDGLMALFTIRSNVGNFNAPGLEMLRIRVAELPAIVQLRQTSKTGVFAQSLAKNAVAPVQAAGEMLMNPADTVKGLPGGVQRFFGRVGQGVQNVAQAATDSDQSGGERAGTMASRIGKTTKDILGYEQEKRHLAKELNVDPYTTNPVLAPLLDEIAQVAFTAHAGVNIAISVAVPGAMAITGTRMIHSWVWDTPRADLIVRNKDKLRQMGAPDGTVRTFMSNSAFPLSVQTNFVENLSHLSGLPGVVNAVALAGTAQSEMQARFLTDAVGMLARYHARTPLSSIIAKGTIVGRERNGTIVVAAPVDYVSWTSRASYFAHRPDLAARKRVALLTGQMSPMAKKNFNALGWTVYERVSL
ncbi:MAG TPA: hypothetical protein VGY99_16715 [Candidatus Binataceae bacterium]|jgi:hypothetical protein|nr:hypothetical protein [Candidatus Binataceae bacterium]